MHSAFKRGVELFSEPESDSVQRQGQAVEGPGRSSSSSEHIEGINGVPKNVTQLKPIIDELMHKVIMITIWSVSANVM